MKYNFLIVLAIFFAFTGLNAQNDGAKATSVIKAAYVNVIPPLSSMDYIAPPDSHQAAPVKQGGANKYIQGKGFPKVGEGDPLMQIQKSATELTGKAPLQSFIVHGSGTLNDPSGAAGPNHYVNAFNSGFAIYSKTGVQLMAEASLGTLFPGETLGDPCVIYDRYADRFLIVEFSNSPNGFLVAVCQGPDPVNDGWFTYRFNTSSFPDYEKISVWSDGYYVTANKDQNAPTTNEVVFALERDEMLTGNVNAQMVGFPLTGVVTSGFYSPAGFNCNGPDLPPAGNAPIVYMQDDAWSGVSDDHLKVWNINVDWNTPASSTISTPQVITTANFDGVFDNGSFVNLPQPNGGNIDALQATIMYMAQYRRFNTHNSAVFNFVVDLDGGDDYAGIRWYELRQANDGAPWTIFQEGTYSRPGNLSAFCGGIAQDKFGNIGLAYTVVSPTVFPSIRFTGRLSSDPINTMTLAEDVIVNGNSNDPTTRYGDYAQMTIDPTDDQTFWHIGEYFNNSTRTSRVGSFKLAPEFNIDLSAVEVVSPTSSTLTANESITINIRNGGLLSITNVPVWYTIDDGPQINGTYIGTIASDEVVSYTFPTTADLSSVGTTYSITVSTNAAGDEFTDNDAISVDVTNLAAVDLGVSAIISPTSGSNLTATEAVTITVENFGGQNQSNFPVQYSINGGTPVIETYNSILPFGTSNTYTFSTTANLSGLGDYVVAASANIPGDVVPSNNGITTIVSNNLCQASVFNLLTDCYSDTESSWRLETDGGVLIQEVAQGTLAEDTQYNYDFCLDVGCYKLIVEDSFGDGLNGAAFACGADGDYSFEVDGLTIFTMANPDFDFIVEHEFCVEGGSGTLVNLRAILQGAFNSATQTMNDNLRNNGVLPLVEPYTGFGFNQVGGGGETTTSAVLNATGPDAIVDWIMVELRDGADATSTIATQVALIQKDGDIVGVDGTSGLTFSGLTSAVYVVLRHRNHFGVRTGNSYLTSSLIDIDFTNPSLSVFGSNAMINIDGLNMLIGGDANLDGTVNSVDNNLHWRLENGEAFDYLNTKADFNLDGVVNTVDKNIIWRINNGQSEQLD